MNKLKLKDIGTIITGNTPSKRNEEFYNKKDINFYTPSDFEDGIINYLNDSINYISEKAREKARILPKNSVLVTCIGIIGKVGITIKESACNQQINAIIPNKDIVNNKYLSYWFIAKSEILRKIANAPVVPIINKTSFENLDIYIPSIKEQEIIVNKLDEIQEIIDINNKQVNILNEIQKSTFIEMFGDPISNNKELNCMEMPSLCEIIDGDRGNNYPKAEEFFENEYCLFLNAKNVTSTGFSFRNCMYITKEKDEKLRNGKLQRGDVILTTRGTVGNLAFYTEDIPFENVRINSGMVILRMKKDVVNEIFFIEQFKMQLEKIKNKIANGSAQPQLPIAKMKGIKVLMPNIELQNKFAEIVKQIDKQKIIYEKNIKILQELMDKLMDKYFN